MPLTGFYSRIIVAIIHLSLCATGQIPATQPATPAVAAEPPTYLIGAGDVLQVDVWKEPDASNAAAVVRPDGKISLPMVGEVQAAGLAPSDLQQTLSEKFGELIRGARVSVIVREINSQRLYILGEVRREGPVSFIAPLTVLQALAEAGGLTPYAKRKRIYVLRMSNGRQVTLPFDYEAAVRGENKQNNPVLLPGDTVVVPR